MGEFGPTTDDEPDPTDTGQWKGPVAADGKRRHPAAHSLADFFRMIESGQFDADVAKALQDAAAELETMADARPGKLKAKLTVTVDIAREPDGLYFLTGGFKIAMPTADRPRSIAWLTGENRFSPNKPDQGHLFGDLRAIEHR